MEVLLALLLLWRKAPQLTECLLWGDVSSRLVLNYARFFRYSHTANLHRLSRLRGFDRLLLLSGLRPLLLRRVHTRGVSVRVVRAGVLLRVLARVATSQVILLLLTF